MLCRGLPNRGLPKIDAVPRYSVRNVQMAALACWRSPLLHSHWVPLRTGGEPGRLGYPLVPNMIQLVATRRFLAADESYFLKFNK